MASNGSGTKGNKTRKSRRQYITRRNRSESILLESAWEVCNQVGGIHTVIRTKAASMVEKWGDHYCLVGPYLTKNVESEFEESHHYNDPIGLAVKRLNERGYEVRYGRWLIAGRPRVILFNPFSIFSDLHDIKYELWNDHGIESDGGDDLIDQVSAFGYLFHLFLNELIQQEGVPRKIITHFHEWMAGVAIPLIRKKNLPVTTVFTTHATMLGRYIAMNDTEFYYRLPFYKWEDESVHFNIDPIVRMERAAAHGAHVFTTVSELTGVECKHLIGRKPDVILPNGINIDRYSKLYEFQNLHYEFKRKIHQFVMGHFFQSYSFDLENTLYFFTSGRFEYRNKGFDLTLEALARLNWRLKQQGEEKTIVVFFVTRQPYTSINPQVMKNRAVMEEIRQTCKAIQKQIGENLFFQTALHKEPKLANLGDYVDEYWWMRLRRTIQSWQSDSLPPVITHNLVNDADDEILSFLRTSGMVNRPEDRVKIVYHPDFISPMEPLLGMEYGQFVRGCDLGIFPSYYEPWGYTPLECIASGVPAITSDLSGFGDFVMRTMSAPVDRGVYVVNRRNQSYEEAADQLANYLFAFMQKSRRERSTMRNRAESSSVTFDWSKVTMYYDLAYRLAFQRGY